MPVPQADSLPKLRHFVEQVVAGATIEEAGRRVELKGRHISYFLAAAFALGLLVRRGVQLVATPRARSLLDSEPQTEGEAAAWRRAIERSVILGEVAPSLLGPAKPTKDALSARIAKFSGLAQSTATRRAETLLRWRNHVLRYEAQLGLPKGASSARAMQYSGPAMLRALHIESFKAFGQPNAASKKSRLPLELAPLTVLAGPNGAGKSTVLQAIDILGSLVRGNISEMLKEHEWDYSDLPHLRSKGRTIQIVADVEIGDNCIEWRITLGTRKHPGIEAEAVRARPHGSLEWKTLLARQGRHITLYREPDGAEVKAPLVTHPQSWLSTLDAKEDATVFPGLLSLKRWAEGIRAFWSLDPSTLRSPSRGDARHVGGRGEDLASLLFKMKKSRPKHFATFTKRLRNYYPRLVQIEPRSAPYGWKYLDVTERWNGEKATFNARQVSDGLLRMMVLASLPEWEEQPSMVLLDEIENGLHPRLVGGITELLAEISKRTQVVVTTHSPITLNYVPAESTRLVTRGRGGSVTVTPLTAVNNFARLREHFDPGEMWFNVGEDALVKHGKRR
ncbi:MAG: AAA family ATPase [Deltaproteobacteria bacterium]|nr:AAA family ATPase [Deltaproteobacteria bacterium]